MAREPIFGLFMSSFSSSHLVVGSYLVTSFSFVTFFDTLMNVSDTPVINHPCAMHSPLFNHYPSHFHVQNTPCSLHRNSLFFVFCFNPTTVNSILMFFQPITHTKLVTF